MKLLERSLFYTRVRNDQNQIVLWTNNGSESLYLYTLPGAADRSAVELHGGAAYAQWYARNGAPGIKPTDPRCCKGFELLRAAVSQPEEKRNRDRPGNLEAAGGPGLVDRPRRASRRPTWARAWSTRGWRTCRRAPASRSIAARPGAAIRSSGTSNEAVALRPQVLAGGQSVTTT